VGLNSLKSLNLTNVYPNNNNKKNKNKKNNKVKSKPLELRSRVKTHGPASDRKEGQTNLLHELIFAASVTNLGIMHEYAVRWRVL
jgi:hypothetical protein